jgi:hypothetical protein
MRGVRDQFRAVAAAAVVVLAVGCSSSAVDLGTLEPAAGPSATVIPEPAVDLSGAVPAEGDAPTVVQEIMLLPPPALLSAAARRQPPDFTAATPIAFGRDLTADERAILETHLAEPVAISGGSSANVQVARVDLDADGQDEVIVTIRSRPYCGNGNVCNFWIFEKVGGAWQPINDGNRDAASRLYLLPGSTGGYRDIGLTGRCGEPSCSFVLKWTGGRYDSADAVG